MATYIYDIPVYLCSERKYRERYEVALKEHLISLEKRSGGITRKQAPITYQDAEQGFLGLYGGPWRFNQIIAWLRLCAGSSSVCADLWLWDTKRFHRIAPQRTYWFRGTEEVVRCQHQSTSRDIFVALVKRFDEYEEAWRGRGFVLDRESIMQLGPFIGWRQILDHAGSLRTPVWLSGFKGTPLDVTR